MRKVTYESGRAVYFLYDTEQSFPAGKYIESIPSNNASYDAIWFRREGLTTGGRLVPGMSNYFDNALDFAAPSVPS